MHEGVAAVGLKSFQVSEAWWLERDLDWLTWVASLEQSLAWYQGKLLTGWALKYRGGHWLMVVHALQRNDTRDGDAVVAFMRARTPHDCFKALGGAIRTQSLDWKEDKFPPFAPEAEV